MSNTSYDFTCRNGETAGKLDLELVSGGLAFNYTRWRMCFGSSGEPFYRIYFPIRGEFDLLFPDQCYRIVPGRIYLIPAHTGFYFKGVNPSHHYWLHFRSDYLKILCQQFEPLFCVPESISTTRAAFHEILRLRKNADTLERGYRIRHLLDELAIPFVKMLQERNGRSYKESSFASEGAIFASVVDMINRDYAKSIRIEKLRKLTDLSRPDFSRRFHQHFGLPPKQYITICRIRHAKLLLMNSSMSIKEVVSMTGFDTEQLFYRIFRRYTLQTPQKYRDSHGLEI